ncbi:MAG: D-amino acid dehydrogenase [Rickettsiales bacterium]|nr:D-amino acid dehydrogenase [Rickettsiales bacterium]
MKVLILGSGVIGVTTAYVLATRGYDVEVIDRAPSAAAETSFANGGQLSYSHAEPWASPSTLPKVFKWMFDDTAPLVLRPRLDYQMLRWGMKFLANCTQNGLERNTVTLLRLGLYSRKMMQDLATMTDIDFHYQRDGILHIFSQESNFEAAQKQVEFQNKFGCQERTKTIAECLQMEPALEHSNCKLVGGIHAHLDEAGSGHLFTTGLAKICEKEYGVKFHYDTTITGIRKESDKIVAVETDKGEFTADKYVMSLGSYSAIYLRMLGMDVPIYPMKGYSLTLDSNTHSPSISVTDQKAKIVFSRLGDQIRIAGTAEFAGYNTTIKKRRITQIKNAAKGLFPKMMESDPHYSEWACLRASTPDGPPIIGSSPISNLFLNTGHGTLGWTQSAGSAFLLADTLEGKETEISLDGMEVRRYL